MNYLINPCNFESKSNGSYEIVGEKEEFFDRRD